MSWPTSIREINDLPDMEKRSIYKTLLPEWLFVNFGMDRENLTINGQEVVQFRCPQGSRALEISVRRTQNDIDPMLYLNMTDTFNHQLLVLLDHSSMNIQSIE